MSIFGHTPCFVCGLETPSFLMVLLGVFFLPQGFAKDPPSPSAASYLHRGSEYYAKGELDRAIADYNIALTFDPNYARAYHSRGLAHRSKGEVDSAIEDYTRAIERDPALAEAYDNRGLALQAKRDWERAIQDHSRA